MSKAGSASKVKINSFDDLFGASQAPAGTEQVREIPLSELHEFKGHPFKVLDDEKMQETVESIRNYGVLMPGIARPRAGGRAMRSLPGTAGSTGASWQGFPPCRCSCGITAMMKQRLSWWIPTFSVRIFYPAKKQGLMQ